LTFEGYVDIFNPKNQSKVKLSVFLFFILAISPLQEFDVFQKHGNHAAVTLRMLQMLTDHAGISLHAENARQQNCHKPSMLKIPSDRAAITCQCWKCRATTLQSAFSAEMISNNAVISFLW